MPALFAVLALALSQTPESPLPPPPPPLISAGAATPGVHAEAAPKAAKTEDGHVRVWTLGMVTAPASASVLEGTWQAGVRAGVELERLSAELSAERGAPLLGLLTADDRWRATVGYALLADPHLRLFVLVGGMATLPSGAAVSGAAPVVGVKGRVGFDVLSVEARAAASTAGVMDGSAEVVLRLGFLAVQAGMRAQVGGAVGNSLVVSPTASLGVVL